MSSKVNVDDNTGFMKMNAMQLRCVLQLLIEKKKRKLSQKKKFFGILMIAVAVILLLIAVFISIVFAFIEILNLKNFFWSVKSNQ